MKTNVLNLFTILRARLYNRNIANFLSAYFVPYRRAVPNPVALNPNIFDFLTQSLGTCYIQVFSIDLLEPFFRTQQQQVCT